MKICWVAPSDANWMQPVIDHIRSKGHTVSINNMDYNFDILFGATISNQDIVLNLHKNYPKIKMVNYNWDVYEWAYKTWPSSIFPYNLNTYGWLLNNSSIVLCPSKSVVYRNKEFFNIPEEKSIIVKSFCPQLNIDKKLIKDDRFVYMPLRKIPDRNHDWFDRAIKELEIPHYISDKKLSIHEYKQKIATCSFLVCPWYEASTGGLSLLEGYFIGKPVLVSDSKYMGANDYFGDRANYFKHDNYDDFKLKVKELWENKQSHVCDPQFMQDYTPEKMADNILSTFESIL